MAIDYTKCICGAKFDFAGFENGSNEFVCPSLCPCTIALDIQGNPNIMVYVVEQNPGRTVYLHIEPLTEHWQLKALCVAFDSDISFRPIVSGSHASSELNLGDGIGAIKKQLELYSLLE